MIAHQPQNGIGPVLPARYRRVTRTLFAATVGLRDLDLLLRDLERDVVIGFRFADLLARELPGQNRVEAFDSLRGVAVGDRLHLERMQLAEFGDLVERQRGVVQKPDGGRLRHQRGCGRHGNISSTLRPPAGRSTRSSMMIGKWPEYRV